MATKPKKKAAKKAKKKVLVAHGQVVAGKKRPLTKGAVQGQVVI